MKRHFWLDHGDEVICQSCQVTQDDTNVDEECPVKGM